MEPIFFEEEIEGFEREVTKGAIVVVGTKLEDLLEDHPKAEAKKSPFPHPPSVVRTYRRLKGKKK